MQAVRSGVIYALDVIGTFVFAVSGAFRAVKCELDLLGVVALSVATGIGGGLVRDMLLGATPAAALTDQTYVAACLVAAVVVFFMAGKIAKRWDRVLIADAVGLGVFTAIGAARAEHLASPPLTVVMMAVITACGGGMIRDLLVREIPAVLKYDFYATAALCGGAFFVGLGWLGVAENIRLTCAITLTVMLRVWAMKYGIGLPRVKSLDVPASEPAAAD